MPRHDYQPILFTYDISVFGRRCDWYLTLRNFKYAHCVQPNRMPRPDLERLGIRHRRVPILAVGRDIYCDSRLILTKLEKMYPENKLGSRNAYEHGLEQILETWVIDGGPFWRSSGLIPPDLDVMLDPDWTADRQEMVGKPFNREVQAAGRNDCYAHMKVNFETLEHGLLADGRDFVFATDRPTLADIHTIWPFDWVIGASMSMGDNLDPDIISDTHFPRVYAWVSRFRDAVAQAASESATGAPEDLTGDQAVDRILASEYWEKEQTVDELDSLRLTKGQLVEVYPTDSGFTHHDRGRLVSLCSNEVVVESDVPDGGGCLRLHFPRHNFKIVPVDDGLKDKKVVAAATGLVLL